MLLPLARNFRGLVQAHSPAFTPELVLPGTVILLLAYGGHKDRSRRCWYD